MKKSIIVMKFGGTSMGSANRMLEVKSIVKHKLKNETHKVGLVLSAVSGVTNMLVDTINGINRIEEIRNKHIAIINELNMGEKSGLKALQNLNNSMNALQDYIKQSAGVFNDESYCKILGLGERISTELFSELLNNDGVSHLLIDPVDYVITSGLHREGEPIASKIEESFHPLREAGESVVLMAGFISGYLLDGKIHHGLLGRNGSDFSGSIMAYGLNADCYENWTDVNGVYTANPKEIPSAVLVDSMNYNEISLLASYGAKVLHHKTTGLIAAKEIPIYIKNTFNPKAAGTKISSATSKMPIKGITVLNNIAYIDAIIEEPIFAEKVKQVMDDMNQDYNLNLQLVKDDKSGLGYIFSQDKIDLFKSILPSKLKKLSNIKLYKDLSVLCIVGKDIGSKILINEKFRNLLESTSTSVLFKKSAEDHLLAVVSKNDSTKLLDVAHRKFFSNKNLVVCLIGAGKVGSEFVERLKELDSSSEVNVKLVGLASSKYSLYKASGIDLNSWKQDFHKHAKESGYAELINEIKKDYTNRECIVVDCTSSKEVSREYVNILNSGINIVTANKIANASNMEYYDLLRSTAFNNKTKFVYGANVGGGTPVINIIKDIKRSGDNLVSFKGVASGSLSMIIGKMEEGLLFSEAVKLALANNYTEPDPRVDLEGTDLANKTLIIAREFGLRLNFSDMVLESFLPQEVKGTVDEFLEKITDFDEYFTNKIESAKEQDKVLRYIGKIEAGVCSVGFSLVDKTDMLATVGNAENIFSFLTEHYQPIPMVLRGYGAGVARTSIGVLRDVMSIGKDDE